MLRSMQANEQISAAGAKLMRILLVINPQASRAKAALADLRTWFAERAELTFVEATNLDGLTQALRAHGPTMDRIVIGGGDGTISGALPELLALGKPLAVLPLGTANDFARTLGLPEDAAAAATVAMEGREHRIDLGRVNGRPFLNVASVGIAAKALKTQSKALKRRWRVLSYPISLLRAVREAQPFHIEVDLDGTHCWSGAVYQASVGNGRFHGGGLTVAEHAAIDDGKFDLYFVRPGAAWQLAASLTHLKFGLAKPDVLKKRTAKHVVLRTTEPRSLNVDGDLVGKTPATFEMLPAALIVLVPRDLDASHRGVRGAGSP